MEYVGQYNLKLENGKVLFPWDIPGMVGLEWIVIESMLDGIKSTKYAVVDGAYIDEYISEIKDYEENVKILGRGAFVLEKDNLWTVPGIIRSHLETDDIVFCGMDSFINVMSIQDMKEYEMLLEELEEKLKIAAIEEGLCDENRE